MGEGRKSMGETIDRPSPFDPRLWTIDHIEGERLASTVGQREAFGARLEASEHFRVALGAGLERVHGDRQVFRRWQALHVKCTVLVWTRSPNEARLAAPQLLVIRKNHDDVILHGLTAAVVHGPGKIGDL